MRKENSYHMATSIHCQIDKIFFRTDKVHKRIWQFEVTRVDLTVM